MAAAGFLIFNAFAMTVTQRRRQIGILRSLGMTRKQVLRQVQTEALMIGAAGTLLGLALGTPFGNLTLMAFQQLGVELELGSASLGSYVLGIVMGLGITLLSVWIPARQATRISPLTALRQETAVSTTHNTSRFQTVAGLLIQIALWTYLVIAPPGEWSGRYSPMEWVMSGVLLIPWLLSVGLLLPALVGGAGTLIRWLTKRLGSTNGRLIADNLTRDRRRVTLTILTFAVGLTMISGLNGFLTFSNEVLLVRGAAGALEQTMWFVYPFDRNSGIAQLDEMNSGAGLSAAVIENFYALAEGRAEVAKNYMVTIPEISSPMPGFFSMMNDLGELTRPGMYNFVEGDWETAVPIMESGCGLLLPPAVASRHDVGVGDSLILPGKDGPVDCTVAGIGNGGTVPVSRISMAAKEQFNVGNPAALTLWPLPGSDETAFLAELDRLADQHGDAAWITDIEEELNAVLDTSDQLETMTYAMLLLAIVAAALGMVNTTVMSVTERRHELGLLRAVGMTRRQATAIVTGEAAMMGVLGGIVGLIGGMGITLIFGLSYGGIPFGLLDLPLWEAAWEAALAAISAGLVGILIAPIISAAAAYWPSRSVLRGAAIETMSARPRPNMRKEAAGLLSRGSIRTRFVGGTAVLMLLVLVGLTGSVTLHARDYLEEVTLDTAASMVELNASLIEFGLPSDTDRLTMESLQNGSINTETMLQLRSLMDEMNAYGLTEFTITDQDNVVLFGFDLRQVGTVLPPLENEEEGETAVLSRVETAVSKTESGQRQIISIAPIYNENGDLLGSVRLQMELGEIGRFLRDLNEAILIIGGFILVLGLTLAYWTTTPLMRTTQQLAAGARQAGQGQFEKIALRKRWDLSLRVKLTAVMVILLILLVGLLEQVILPIERQKVEEITQSTLIAGAELMAEMMADFGLQISELDNLQSLIPQSTFRNLQSIGQV
ncbi:MAG: FtsX-like permease family protein, partial [Rhodobacteraceae bacterium]|nr:FtsX-like permease family protein [Paracoccaceae bacterium]